MDMNEKFVGWASLLKKGQMQARTNDVAKRDFLKLQLSPEAKADFERLYTGLGMSQIQAATRVFVWFMEQDEVTRATILGLIPDAIKQDVARNWLERMANSPAQPAPARRGTKATLSDVDSNKLRNG